MVNILLYLAVGLAAGIFSGLFGVGGGIIMVPAIVFLFGLSQHAAQGTTLALMVFPIGLLAAWTYYKAGNVNITIAAFVALGFFFGGLFGAKFAHNIPEVALTRLFGIVMLVVALKMIFK
jgi:hypothetical protein